MTEVVTPPSSPTTPTPPWRPDWRTTLVALLALGMVCATALVIAGKLPLSALAGAIPIVIALLVPSPIHPERSSPLQAILAAIAQLVKPPPAPPAPPPSVTVIDVKDSTEKGAP